MTFYRKQGQSGTIGNWHTRSSQGFFRWGFKHCWQLLHGLAKHPSQFLQRFFLFPPTKTRLLFWVLLPILDIATAPFNSFLNPHIHTLSLFKRDRFFSSSKSKLFKSTSSLISNFGGSISYKYSGLISTGSNSKLKFLSLKCSISAYLLFALL